MHSRRTVAILLALGLLLAACGDDDTEPDPEAERTAYVALGDSYAAGGGAPPYDVEPATCARSSKAWPFVFARDAADLVDDVELRACGGAKIDHLFGLFQRGDALAQLPAEPNPDVGLVTLTIGGNDAALATTIAACATADCSSLATSPDLVATLAQITDRLADEVYPALRTAYPNARLVHVGYTHVVPPVGEPVQDCPWLVDSVRAAPNDIVDVLNAALERATEETAEDVTFVDVADALEGHELCSFSPWLHPLAAGVVLLHPTAEGYEAIGEAVAEALDR